MALMIRPATAGDVIGIVDMIEDLRAAVGGVIPVDRPWTARFVAGLIQSDDAAVWVSGGGFIACSLQPTVINPRAICMEHGWFARDGSGLRLLRRMEHWAAEKGALLVQVSTGAEGLDLGRLGYRLAERAWVK